MNMADGSVLRITAIRKAKNMVHPALRMPGNLSMAIGGRLTKMVMRRLAGLGMKHLAAGSILIPNEACRSAGF